MIRLRPYKPSDAEAILRWWEKKDKESFLMWSAGKLSWPLTREQLDEYYETWGRKETTGWPMTALDENGAVVGQLLMRLADYEEESLRFGFIVVDPEIRGRGYGHQMMSQALRYAFDILGVRKVTLGVFEKNPDALVCYERAGFQVNGTESYVIEEEGHAWTVLTMEAVKLG